MRTPVNAAMINAVFAGKNVRYASAFVGCAQRALLKYECKKVMLQNNNPKPSVYFMDGFVVKVVFGDGCIPDIVAPSMANIIQGKSGYVPVKSMFERMVEGVSSLILSVQIPAP